MSKDQTSEIFDRRRRGEPLLGCDCMQCFGYCIVDRDIARREIEAIQKTPYAEANETD